MQPSPLSLTVLVWAKSFWDANGPATHSFTKFCYHFREVFGQAAHSLSVNDQLLGLHQGQSSITELHTSILQQMAIYEDVIHLENFIQQSVHNSLRFTECDMDSAAVASAPVTPSLSLPAPRPIQINTVHLCTTEQQ
ncbi:Histidine protein kinase SLN1 [Labeo rohita]|uniref:Histidine protein kinase SLN1 n=1 Tax=Labeo rohita TaxID=84645 RepID=A0ABQ8LZE8_LABRO|nr:Histidine protein kinase SLN1 [Labeo rohita]